MIDIHVLDQDWNVVGVIDSYDSFIWTDRYNSYGDFELYSKFNSNILSIVKNGYYLSIKDSDRLMIIETIALENDYEKGNIITVQGRSLESILDRRVIWDSLVFENVGLGSLIKTLLYECIINPDDDARKIDNFIFSEPIPQDIEDIEVESTQLFGENLLEVIVTLCQKYKIGYKLILDSDKNLVFSLYLGADRTENQSINPVVVFSSELDNLLNSQYAESSLAYKNTCLVLGEGDGSDKTKVEVKKPGAEYTGIDRREMCISESIGTDGDTTTNLNYPQQLYQKGTDALTENKMESDYNGQVDPTRVYIYEQDYNLGDLIEIINDFKLSKNARVVEYIRSYSDAGINYYPAFAYDVETEENTTYNVISYNVYSARKAVEDAEAAADAAASAVESAASAEQSASDALTAAQSAQTAAGTAWSHAEDAYNAASNAVSSANTASAAAARAESKADEATTSAIHANAAANGALTQLSIVEQVLDTLSWIAEHGTYVHTTDVTVNDSKVYYVNTGTAQNPVYTPVADPKDEELSTYYELSIDAAVSDYVASHLALTDAGLYVLKDSTSYKVLVSNTGVQIQDHRGVPVATYGQNIQFSEDVEQYIGGENAYIRFNPITGVLTIGGTQVTMGTKTLSQILNSVDNSLTDVKIEYAVGNSPTVAPTTGWSESSPTWTTGKYIWQRTTEYVNGVAQTPVVVCIQGAKGETGTPVNVSEIKYAVSTTENQPNDSAFTYSNVPTVAEGNWLWTRVTYSDTSKVYLKAKQGAQGPQGNTPYIQNGYWYINGTSTGIQATGDDGNTPYIGVDNYWYIDGVSTGIKALGEDGDYVIGMTLYYKLDVEEPTIDTTVKPPVGWITTQPELSDDLDYVCYVVILTEYNSGSFYYSNISIFSEYEAAKTAQITAEEARQQIADTNKYFSFKSGIDAGAYITLEDGVDPLASFTSDGVTIFDLDGTPIAQYGLSTIIGNQNGFHVSIDGQELGFYEGDTKVAFINNNQLHISQSVVLDEMQIGENKWTWKMTNDDSLYLKWLG